MLLPAGLRPHGPRCADHARDANAARKRASLYNLRVWRDDFRGLILHRNPICQRLTNGERCRRPSVVVHHLVHHGHENMALLLDPKNVVAVCPEHHPGGEQGTPWWKEGVDFAPTEWKDPLLEGEPQHKSDALSAHE